MQIAAMSLEEKGDVEMSSTDMYNEGEDDTDAPSSDSSEVPHSPRHLKLAAMILLLGLYAALLTTSILQGKKQCTSMSPRASPGAAILATIAYVFYAIHAPLKVASTSSALPSLPTTIIAPSRLMAP